MDSSSANLGKTDTFVERHTYQTHKEKQAAQVFVYYRQYWSQWSDT